MTKGERKATEAVKFINGLKHTKGRWAGTEFGLRNWQEKVIRDVFGTLKADGTRQYRSVYAEIPRKNGKSSLAAAVALLLLFWDGEQGAEIYVAAGDRDQATLIYGICERMISQEPRLQSRCNIVASQKRIVREDSGSFLRVISSEAYSKFGFSSHGIIFDELHVQPNRDLWDALTTSTGARTQPLTFAITTAGYDRNSICWELHEYAEKVQNGIIEDDTFYPVLYAADQEADWTDEKIWHECNPALGDFRDLDEMRTMCRKAQEVPALENTFRRLYLNQWTRQETRWLPMHRWDDSAREKVDADGLAGRVCYGGLDLATVNDVAAFVLVFPEPDGFYTVLPFFWIPEENMHIRARRDRVPYDVWTRAGLIEATPGRVIDYRHILACIDRCARKYDLVEIAFDRWGATKIIQDLEDMGFKDEKDDSAQRHLIQFGQGYKSMSPPTKELLKLVLEGKIRHGANPVLRWMADNLVVTEDPAQNVKPDKAKSTEKIDGMTALIMGLDRAIRSPSPKRSVYEERGPLVFKY